MICYICKKEPTEKVYRIFHRAKNRERYACVSCWKNKLKRYSASKGKNALVRASMRAYENHKEKWQARAKVRYAVKTGKLFKPLECTDCKEVKKLQGHHEDYTKPLEVIWLCVACHAKADKALGIRKGRITTPLPSREEEK